MWFQVGTQKLYPMVYIADTSLAIVQGQAEILQQEFSYLGYKITQPVPVARHDIEVIHIATVMLALHLTLHPLVEDVHIDVGEKLRGKVANRQTTAGRRIEQ